ncbi:MAG: cytochrome c [Gammaproteobacteria bacterium]
MRRIAKIVCVLAMSAGSVLPYARAEDNPVIEYRQRVMRTLQEQSAALGQILSTVIPDDNMPAHLEAIALTASVALNAFKPKVEGGESLPDVWNQWDDFSKRMNEFARKAAEVAKAAKTGTASKEELMTGMTDALNCKSCHDVYRLPE